MIRYLPRAQRVSSLTTLVLLVLIVGILFPYGWLAAQWPLFDRVVERLFHTEMAHVLGHLTLFALLGCGLHLFFPRLRDNLPLYLLLVLVIGAAQEGLQLITFKSRGLSWADLFDLLVDVVGAWLAYAWIRRQQRRSLEQ